MQKRKRWQFILILVVIALTLYNILPTIFFYTKPLKETIGKKGALNIAFDSAKRVNKLEEESISWLSSYCKMLKLKPISIQVDKTNPSHVKVAFNKNDDANELRKYLPRAGSLIPFIPAQLFVIKEKDSDQQKNVVIQRQIPINIDSKNINEYFDFSEKKDGRIIAPLFKDVVFDRAIQMGLTIGGESEAFLLSKSVVKEKNPQVKKDLIFSLARDILDFTLVFGENSLISDRYFSSFTQGDASNKNSFIDEISSSFSSLREELKKEKMELKKESPKEKYIKQENNEKIALVTQKENILIKAENIVKRQKQKFLKGQKPWNYDFLKSTLNNTFNNQLQTLKIGFRSIFFDSIVIDWANDKILLNLKKDVQNFRNKIKPNLKDRFEQLIINDVARITRKTDEKITYSANSLVVDLNSLTNSKSFLVLNLKEVASVQSAIVKNILETKWIAEHRELVRENFPIYDYNTYLKLPKEKQQLCLVVYAPIVHSNVAPEGLRANSIYVMAKGIDRIIKKYEQHKKSHEANLFIQDFNNLQEILKQNGFRGFSASSILSFSDFANDFIFEKSDYYNNIIAATREDFKVHGTKKFAILEFTDVEQRILTLNQIQTSEHESLLKWKDDYNAAQVSMNSDVKFDVPPPNKNAFINNIALSFKKYFRGDDRKILHWGLDLSGGKTVQIELRDQNNKIVKNEDDLKQGVNELNNRVNKMGVSEVNIRTIDSNIVLDFPGSQNLSASDLVKASTMYFNVVNEKFSIQNSTLAESVNRFLQEIWNEAVVTNRKDIDSINRIAYNHLYGGTYDSNSIQPRTEAAKELYENGLKLSSPEDSVITSALNDAISKVAIYRGDDFSSWHGQTHPLLVTFKNYALEGANLENIRPSYDPTRGNFLSFEVASSSGKDRVIKVNPRDELYAWTSQFSKEKIDGTPLAKFTGSKGWRMAVILNDFVISAPNLESPLRDSAMISGSFSQREINLLAADLKAGSLTFTPKILSEKNVSPELGRQERVKGIVATCLSLVLVVIAMICYYRFSGLIASIAVILNLLIMWAALQNIQATLSLAGIAGVILTVGMAVDANVLVFERIKEEFALTGRIVSSIQVGYKKAFSAILDSNITTVIAAIILLNFDAGPIKGFAITLIIGIISSMFTALFMTRYFFTKWAENPNNKKLTMMNLIRPSSFNFLKSSKFVISILLIIICFGAYFLTVQRNVIFGMDFTGGFSFNVELEETNGVDYRTSVEKALIKAGLSSKEVQVRELNPSNNLRIMLSSSLEHKGNPFYEMPLEIENLQAKYSYENNPRISWVVSALAKDNIKIKENNLKTLETNWTSMSGQMSDSVRNSAVYGLLLALFCILIYITIRFEFKYAISAMICLIHDVLITLAIIAILHLCGLSIQIDMHTIAAIMTIIGYSLNDTIIVFDRIREDVKQMRKSTLSEIVNHALNITLSRTTITSGTTLLVLLALVVLGGSTIFNFALVMIIGVIFGTLSSLFIASPLMLFFHKIEQRKDKKLVVKDS